MTFERRLLLCALLALVGCEQEKKGEPGGAAAAEPPDAAAAPMRRVDVLKVTPQTFEERIEVTAHVEAPQDATLSARTGGTVLSVKPLGAEVKEGEVVMRLDPALPRAALGQAEAQVEAARSALELAQDTLRRQAPLAEQQIISALEFRTIQSRVNQAEAQLAQAKAARKQAREQLDLSALSAPFAGTVEARMVDPGEQVNPNQPVLRLVDTSHVKVRAGVPERYATEIGKGAQVRIRFNAYGIEPRTGEVSFVGRTIDPESRTFPVEIELDNPQGKLKPEMVARVVLTRSRTEGALAVPQNAVLRSEEGLALFVVVEKDGQLVAERRAVKLGPRDEGRVVVTEGLAPGDRVVVRGQDDLAAGERVEVAGES